MSDSPKANAVTRLCYLAGQASYEDGEPLGANPWPIEANEHRAWAAGWFNAEMQAKALAAMAPTVH